MAGASIYIDIENDSAAKKVLQQLLEVGQNLDAPFADIGEYLLNSHRERWARQEAADGTPWAPLAPKTVKRKKKNQNKILVLEGDLRDLLRYQTAPDGLEFGTDRIYGATHQFGDEERGIPARPPLGLTEEDRVEILDILQEHLERASGG
ncbi:MAG: phage virion morphogenesis protein [Chromatiales bacterium]|nr:phage virion morphogenesis protein [Chromatiales bacterium]